MGDFFHGWRQKAGCIALVMACASMAGWVRSLYCPWSYRINHAERVYWLELRDGIFNAFQFRPEQMERPVSMLIDYEAEHRITIAFSAWAQTLTLLSAILLLWPGKRP